MDLKEAATCDEVAFMGSDRQRVRVWEEVKGDQVDIDRK